MNKKNKFGLIFVAAVTVVLVCVIMYWIQVGVDKGLQTAVAQTAAAKAVDSQRDTLQPVATVTLVPTDTQPSAPTNTPIPCNKAELVSETIEDGTEFDPNITFTKTWRLKNVGTCTWNTKNKLTFASGDQMDGPAVQNLPKNVAPGEQIDISIDMTAPASEGTYQGSWKIEDENGQVFENNLWVEINVNPVSLNSYTATLDVMTAESGTIWSNGDMYPGDYSVGDAVGNFGVQTFSAFDISDIPSNAIINEVKVDLTNSLALGDPFGGLGCLRLYPDTYQPLNAGDYKSGVDKGADARWCNQGELGTAALQPDLAEYLQSLLGNQYMAFRLQFNEHESDNDNTNDVLGFFTLSIIVQYQAP